MTTMPLTNLPVNDGLGVFFEPERLACLDPLGDDPYRRLSNALQVEVAQSAFGELRDQIEYEREDILNMTRMWRARVDGSGQLVVKPGARPPSAVLRISEALRQPWFASCLSRLAGEEVSYIEAPKVYCLLHGDRIMIHEDDHEPNYRVAVIFHFCEHWSPSDGGAFVIGQVARREHVPVPEGFPIPILRRRLARGAAHLAPEFNSLLVIRIGNNLGHGVMPVRARHGRYGIVCIFGKRLVNEPVDPPKFGYALPAVLRGSDSSPKKVVSRRQS